MQRRTFLIGSLTSVAALGLVAGVAQQLGRLDDGARAIGIAPVPQPHPDDLELVRLAAQDTARLVDLAATSRVPDPRVKQLLGEHLTALGGRPDENRGAEATAPEMDVLDALDRASVVRAEQCVAAVSGDLARTLGSMSVALQVAATWDGRG